MSISKRMLFEELEKIDPETGEEKTTMTRAEIEDFINRNSLENGSNTPDFILAEFVDEILTLFTGMRNEATIRAALTAFDKASNAREKWYGVKHRPGGSSPTDELQPADDDVSDLPPDEDRDWW